MTSRGHRRHRGKWPQVGDVTADFVYIVCTAMKSFSRPPYIEPVLTLWTERIRAGPMGRAERHQAYLA
jgi:hypothetical protein